MKKRKKKPKKKKPMPGHFSIVGQSGSGKELVMGFMQEYFSKTARLVLRVSTGDEVRAFIKKDTYLARRMKEINNQGLRQPVVMGTSLWLEKIKEGFTGREIILHEGSPRYVEEFNMMYELAKVNYFGSLMVIEVEASNPLCKRRLIYRTEQDQRSDLSLTDFPGVPDLKKIATKMKWWTSARAKIVEAAQKKKCYLKINNSDCSKEELKERVFALLDQFEI